MLNEQIVSAETQRRWWSIMTQNIHSFEWTLLPYSTMINKKIMPFVFAVFFYICEQNDEK